MKRFSAFILILLCLLGGCGAQPERAKTPAPSVPARASTPAPAQALTPAPTLTPAPLLIPTPAPVNVLLLADCAQADVPEYAQAIRAAAESAGWRLTEQYESLGTNQVYFGAYAGVLVLLARAQTSAAAVSQVVNDGAACAVLDLTGHDLPASASSLRFSAGDAAEFTLAQALAYPPHDTPVRLIALLEKKGSPADKAFRTGVSQGKIFNKGIFYAGGKPAKAAEYMKARLKKYVVGTVDAVFAEDTALAQQAILELHAASRTDMEVFAAPQEFLPRQSALLERFVFPIALGVDPSETAARQAEMLRGLLAGDAPRQEAIQAAVQTLSK